MKAKKIDFIQMNLRRCETNACKVYMYGGIPDQLLKNACMTYADHIYGHSVRRGDVLGLIDSSVMGNGKVGVLFTEDGMFYKHRLKKPGYISYRTIKKTEHIPDDIYANCNQLEIKKLIDGLVKIDMKDEWNNWAGTLNEKMDNFDDVIDNMTEIGEKVADFLERICNKINR